MQYELLNKLLRDVIKENYTKIGDIEYCYLEECTYAVRKVGDSFPILLKARSPEQALNSFIQHHNFDGFVFGFKNIVREMLHCIGYDKITRFKPYRNYYSTVESQSINWEKAVEMGLAEKIKHNKYKVSKHGFRFLEEICNLKLEEEK